MRTALFYILFGVMTFQVCGQITLPDSLVQKVDLTNDALKIQSLISDANKLVYNEPEMAHMLAQKIIDLSGSLDYPVGEAKGHDIIGIYFQNRSQFDSAYTHFRRSLQLRTRIGRPRLLAESYNNFGVINRRQGTYDSALYYYGKALELALESNDSLLIGNYNNNIGLVHENKAEWEQALRYHTKSLQVREQMDDKKGLAGSLNNIGIVYQRMNDHEQALDYLMRSLEIKKELDNKRLLGSAYINLGVSYYGLKQYDQALASLEQSLLIYQELDDIQSVASAYDNLSFVAKAKRELPLAISYELKSMAIRDSIGNIFEQVQSHASMSDLYVQANDLANALKQARVSYDLAMTSKAPENLKLAAEHLSNALEASGNYAEALKYHKIFTANKDSLLDKEKVQSIAELREKYEAEKKEEQIKLQALEVSRQDVLINSRSLQRNILVAAAIALLLVLFLLIRNYRTKLKVKEQIAAQTKALEQTRSRFFVNISHEFRTPLTLISGPLKRLLSRQGFSGDERQQLEIMDRNAGRLKRLINQLLDLSRLESNKLRLNLQEENVVQFIRTTTASFGSLAEQKDIAFDQQFPSESIMARFDPDKLEAITYNLLSNAFKFTPNGGSVKILVELKADPGTHIMKLSVEDSGTGLSSQEIAHIFDRFYQTSSSEKNAIEGTGIGLALTKELVKLMEGTIEVKSSPGKGSTFEVHLPLTVLGKGSVTALDDKRNQPAPISPVTPDEIDVALPIVLVVEDNSDLRLHITQCLGHDYRFIEADNGQKGWDLAREHLPDLIISDLMMPEMNGLELCQLVKSSEGTSHIPFIMLTAKATDESKIEALETGADDYIFKPFEGKELYLKARNLLEQRRKLQHKLQSELLLHPIPSEQMSQDQRFLHRVRELIEKYMGDPKLNVMFLSNELGLSRTQVYRKVSALSGLSVTELIRNMRIKKAANLLEQNWGTVSDIGYEVGFNSLSYFAKCFKQSYGASPSEYLLHKKSGSSSKSQ